MDRYFHYLFPVVHFAARNSFSARFYVPWFVLWRMRYVPESRNKKLAEIDEKRRVDWSQYLAISGCAKKACGKSAVVVDS
jgi:hypothetical protein